MDDIIGAGLREPETAIGYETNRRVREAAGGRAVLTSGSKVELLGFARAGHAQATLVAGLPHEVLTNWEGPLEGLVDGAANARFEVLYGGHRLEVVAMQWMTAWKPEHRTWVLADDEAVARAFLTEVSRWSAEVHDEVLVFQDGCFSKSTRLHEDLRRASWEDLVLRGAEKDEIARDFERFFASKEAYARAACPWRRGALFMGPPGNGKTHCVKALVKRLGKPTIYVRGFRHRYRTTADCISEVFERARRLAPCVLVLEDLDGLFDPEGLAFFLNELDGFGENSGLVTLGTTNHPERLDPALLDRPSRFDRTYAFELPHAEDRRRFLVVQNAKLADLGALSAATIDELVDATHEFSFAYLKELVMGALVAVVGGAAHDTESAARAIVPRLREQLGRAREIAARPIKPAKSDDD
ncbi:MAG TPA: AAA family ATPase [Byssovorax sp.]|jgi:hypothetical protein